MPAIYPMLKTRSARLRPDRPDHADLPVHGVAAAAARRHLHRSSSPSPIRCRRHGLHARRPARCSSLRRRFRCSCSAAALVGIGSSVFHPESSRVARMASGGQHGLAQSLFQVGGNAGSALGPLLAAFIVVPRGQQSIAWFSVGGAARRSSCCRGSARWYSAHPLRAHEAPRAAEPQPAFARRRKIAVSMAVLVAADLLEVLLHGEPDAATTPST